MAFSSTAENQPTPASHTEFLFTIPGGGRPFLSFRSTPMVAILPLNSEFFSDLLAVAWRSPLVGSQGHGVQPNKPSGHYKRQPLQFRILRYLATNGSRYNFTFSQPYSIFTLLYYYIKKTKQKTKIIYINYIRSWQCSH